MNNEDKILTMLDNIQKQIGSMENRFNTMESNTNNRFDNIENRFDTMENRFDTMGNRFDAMEKFIAKEIQSTRDELKLEIQHVYDEVKEIKEDFNNIEQVTAKNWLDISRLKAVR